MKRRVRIVSGLEWLFGSLFALFGIAWTGIVTFLATPDLFPRVFMTLLCVVNFLMTLFYALPRLILTLVLTPNEIYLTIPFKKRAVLSYDDFPYIYCGAYFHGNIFGMGRMKLYVVFSGKRMTTDELLQVNLVGNSSEVFKIRATPKIYNKLCEILPSQSLFKLRAAFNSPVAKRPSSKKHKKHKKRKK